MEKIKIRGKVIIELRDTEGKLVEKREVDNAITNVGLAVVAGLVGNVDSQTAFTYLAVGIGTTPAAAGDTTLESEITDTGLERASATVSRITTTQTNDTLQLLKTWTATGAKAVTEVGTFNHSSTGTMLGHTIFSAINTSAGFELTIKHQFIFS